MILQLNNLGPWSIAWTFAKLRLAVIVTRASIECETAKLRVMLPPDLYTHGYAFQAAVLSSICKESLCLQHFRRYLCARCSRAEASRFTTTLCTSKQSTIKNNMKSSWPWANDKARVFYASLVKF